MRHPAAESGGILYMCRPHYRPDAGISGSPAVLFTPLCYQPCYIHADCSRPLHDAGIRSAGSLLCILYIQILQLGAGRVGCSAQDEYIFIIPFGCLNKRPDTVNAKVRVNGYSIFVPYVSPPA